jgi:hypothetical protein
VNANHDRHIGHSLAEQSEQSHAGRCASTDAYDCVHFIHVWRKGYLGTKIAAQLKPVSAPIARTEQPRVGHQNMIIVKVRYADAQAESIESTQTSSSKERDMVKREKTEAGVKRVETLRRSTSRSTQEQ